MEKHVGTSLVKHMHTHTHTHTHTRAHTPESFRTGLTHPLTFKRVRSPATLLGQFALRALKPGRAEGGAGGGVGAAVAVWTGGAGGGGPRYKGEGVWRTSLTGLIGDGPLLGAVGALGAWLRGGAPGGAAVETDREQFGIQLTSAVSSLVARLSIHWLP